MSSILDELQLGVTNVFFGIAKCYFKILCYKKSLHFTNDSEKSSVYDKTEQGNQNNG